MKNRLITAKEAKEASEHLISSEDNGDAPEEAQKVLFAGLKAGIPSALRWQKKFGWCVVRFIPEPTIAWIEK